MVVSRLDTPPSSTAAHGREPGTSPDGHGGAPPAPGGVAARPQPLGAFPLPAGYLLIPAGPETEQVRTELLAGRLPAEWPESLRALELAHAGDREGALALLRAAGDPVSRYNRYVLDPDGDSGAGAEEQDLAELRAGLGRLGVLVDVVAFVIGRSDTLPELGDLDGELAALVLSAHAGELLADGEPVVALELLDSAVAAAGPVAPPLAGLLAGAAASVARDIGPEEGTGSAVVRFERALRLLDGAEDLRIGRAELHLNLAGVLHEASVDQPGLLSAAIPHYHSALQLVLRDEAPELWAAAHANLATAYLTLPMTGASDQLRLGVAAQSLRSALKVYTPQTHPQQWASTQLNLANSLVYAPSTHPRENLMEAVELYEAVLATRDRETEPLGRARVLANQGNALAHLGAAAEAKAKLYEARFLFEELGDLESVRAVRGVLDEIARQASLARTGDDAGTAEDTAPPPAHAGPDAEQRTDAP